MNQRRERTLLSLDGLSVGDALGERFFGPPADSLARIAQRKLPKAPWTYTDDTEMALSIVETLFEHGRIDQDDLAQRFGRRYTPWRGYGAGAHQLMQLIRIGGSWRDLAPAMFGGSGSYGNGAAMRVSPLGAFFADDIEAAAENAALSAEVTHAHPEGIAGGVAVAVAAAVAWQQGESGRFDADALFETVLSHTPQSLTRRRIERAAAMPADTPIARVAGELGSGREISAQDTVPYTLWCAAHHLHDYEQAFWTTVEGLGDIDTTCAIVGGIVALSSRAVPDEWLARCEPLELCVDSRKGTTR